MQLTTTLLKEYRGLLHQVAQLNQNETKAKKKKTETSEFFFFLKHHEFIMVIVNASQIKLKKKQLNKLTNIEIEIDEAFK